MLTRKSAAAGRETLTKPWNEGKAEHATADLLQYDGIDFQLHCSMMVLTSLQYDGIDFQLSFIAV